MEILQLEYFIAVCDTGSFTAAAEACFTSRQNLTRSIKRLESEMGTTLFARSGNAMVPTLAGKQALTHARIIVDEARYLQGAFVAQERTTRPNVLLATNTSTFMPKRFFSNGLFSQVDVSEHVPSKCHRAVVEGEADVALVMSMRKKFVGCTSVVLNEERLCFLVGEQSSLAQKREISAHDLKGHEICVLPDRDFVYGELLARYRSEGLDERLFRTVGNIGLVKSAIRSNDAVAIVPESFDPSRLGGIALVPCDNPDDTLSTCCLYRRRTSNSAAIMRFIADLQKIYAS